jgi:hypothetical protein
MNWLLIIVIHAGLMSHNDDIAVSSVRMNQQNACEAAGKAVVDKLSSTYQHADWVCIHDADGPK